MSCKVKTRKSEALKFEKPLVLHTFSQSPIRTLAPKIGLTLSGRPCFYCSRRNSKAQPERSEGTKQSGGLFCRVWESPSKSRCIQYGSRLILNMSENEIQLSTEQLKPTSSKTGGPQYLTESHLSPLVKSKLLLWFQRSCSGFAGGFCINPARSWQADPADTLLHIFPVPDKEC